MPQTWPCDILPTAPPPVGDALSAPAADDLTPQVLACVPRGPPWGTDEAGDGRGASPNQLALWRGIAAVLADWHARAWQTAMQAFPTAGTYGLDDWERELGLPDPCGNPPESTAARVAAVRSRLVSAGSASPAYMICVARAAGYDVTIEEPTAFECGGSELGPGVRSSRASTRDDLDRPPRRFTGCSSSRWAPAAASSGGAARGSCPTPTFPALNACCAGRSPCTPG